MDTQPDRIPAAGPAGEWATALIGVVALLVITAAWWALALWPVEDAPAWLERTRYVCFGVTDSGLPDAGGWIGLIGGPLGMFAILVIGWARGFRALLWRARRSRPLGAVVGAIVLGFLLLPVGAVVRVRQAVAATPNPSSATLAATDHPRLDRGAPPLELLAHDGRALDLEAFRGQPVLLTFAYAHCQTVCPLVVRDALDAQLRLQNAGIATTVLVVTLDPWRDTPSRLPAMAEGWKLPSADAYVLGGAIEEVEAVLDAWSVARTRDLRTGEVTHPALVYVIDRDGRIAFATTGGADRLVQLVERL